MLTHDDLLAIEGLVNRKLTPSIDVVDLKADVVEIKTALTAVKVKLSLMQGDLNLLVNLHLGDAKRESHRMRIHRSDEPFPAE